MVKLAGKHRIRINGSIGESNGGAGRPEGPEGAMVGSDGTRRGGILVRISVGPGR